MKFLLVFAPAILKVVRHVSDWPQQRLSLRPQHNVFLFESASLKQRRANRSHFLRVVEKQQEKLPFRLHVLCIVLIVKSNVRQIVLIIS